MEPRGGPKISTILKIDLEPIVHYLQSCLVGYTKQLQRLSMTTVGLSPVRSRCIRFPVAATLLGGIPQLT